MATDARIAVGLLPATISGTVDLTVSGFGTPDAAFIYTTAGGSNNPQNTAQGSAGFWDGTNQFSMGFECANANATATTGRGYHATNAIAIPQSSGAAWRIRASAAAMTDGIKLTVTEDNIGSEKSTTAILFKGLTNAYCGVHTNDGTTGANDITAPGFKPDLVLIVGIGSGTSTYTTNGRLSVGAIHNNSSDVVTQGCIQFESVNGTANSTVSTYIDDDKCGHDSNSASSIYTLSGSAFDSSGFSLTSSVGNTDNIIYLALQLADPDDAYVGIVDSKTTTGTQAYTGTGFTPEVLLLLQTYCTAVDTITTTGYFGMGATDGTTEHCSNHADEHNQAVTDTEGSFDASNVLHITDDTPADDAVAAYSSFDSDGFTLNYSDGSASARKMLAICVGNSVAAGGGGFQSAWAAGANKIIMGSGIA